jgi:methylmalonyl-CoA mutase
LATAAWEMFLDLEKQGGYYALLANGKLAEICAQSAETRAHQYAEQAEVLIGANKYPYNGEAKSTNLPWITFHENRLLKAKYLAY